MSRDVSNLIKKSSNGAQFSFKGYYSGQKIKSLFITHDTYRWEKNEEYVIYIAITGLDHNCLQGEAIKIKKLSEFLMKA